VPPSFAFSLLLPRPLAELQVGKTQEDSLARSVEAARALQASVLVLATPPTVRPTKANVDRITELAAKLPRDAHLLAWEPSGLWSPEEIARVAASSGWLPVVDAAEHEVHPGPVVYTRLRAIGKATRLGPHRLQHIASELAGRREAFVVADPRIGPKLAASLEAALSRVGGERDIPLIFKPSQGIEHGGFDDDLEGFDEEQ